MQTFQVIRKSSRLFRNFPDNTDTFWTIWKLSRFMETLQIIWKLSILSGNFPDYQETFQTIRKLSRPSRNFPVKCQGLRAKTFPTRKNFPDGIATMSQWFLCLWGEHLCRVHVNLQQLSAPTPPLVWSSTCPFSK